MKLSEAIRLGAMLKPQAFGAVQRQGTTCAIGAAYDAIGALSKDDGDGMSEEDFLVVCGHLPLLAAPNVQCPACSETPYGDDGSMCANIAHLNDWHRWTREQIADWVASQEALAEPRTEDAVREAVEVPIVTIRA